MERDQTEAEKNMMMMITWVVITCQCTERSTPTSQTTHGLFTLMNNLIRWWNAVKEEFYSEERNVTLQEVRDTRSQILTLSTGNIFIVISERECVLGPVLPLEVSARRIFKHDYLAAGSAKTLFNKVLIPRIKKSEHSLHPLSEISVDIIMRVMYRRGL